VAGSHRVGGRGRRGDGLRGVLAALARDLLSLVDRHEKTSPVAPHVCRGGHVDSPGTRPETPVLPSHRKAAAPPGSRTSHRLGSERRALTNSTGVVPWRRSGTPGRAPKRNFRSTPVTTVWNRVWARAAWVSSIWPGAPPVCHGPRVRGAVPAGGGCGAAGERGLHGAGRRRRPGGRAALDGHPVHPRPHPLRAGEAERPDGPGPVPSADGGDGGGAARH